MSVFGSSKASTIRTVSIHRLVMCGPSIRAPVCEDDCRAQSTPACPRPSTSGLAAPPQAVLPARRSFLTAARHNGVRNVTPGRKDERDQTERTARKRRTECPATTTLIPRPHLSTKPSQAHCDDCPEAGLRYTMERRFVRLCGFFVAVGNLPNIDPGLRSVCRQIPGSR